MTSNGHLAQPCSSEQGHLELDEVAQSSAQADLGLGHLLLSGGEACSPQGSSAFYVLAETKLV